MANNCWNSVIITGDIETLKLIESKFKSIENGVLNYKNYHKIFEGDVSDIEGEDWGSKWHTPTVTLDNDKLLINGDSAWTPAIQLYELISEEYEVDCVLTYEETGMDFAGVVKWEKGDMVESEEYTAWEYRFISDTDLFYEEAEYSVICYDSVSEWVDSLNLNKWKEKPDLDIDRLEKFWETNHEN